MYSSSGMMPSFSAILKYLYLLCAGRIFLFSLSCLLCAQAQAGDPKNLSLNGVNLSARVLLQGPYDPDTGLMANNLQASGHLPDAQPFSSPPFEHTGSEQLDSIVATAPEQDAPVDWVLLEIRESTSPYYLVDRRAAILQRDGDVVEPDDGAVVLNFPDVVAGDYRISVRHRNHIGVMTASDLALSTEVTLVDFSRPETAIFGSNSRIFEGSYALLWGGDSTQDNRLINSGIDNDNNPVLSSLLLEEDNTGFNSSYIIDGYELTDLNMDGKTIYSGPGNDINLLIFNVLTHPGNDVFANNYIVSTDLSF